MNPLGWDNSMRRLRRHTDPYDSDVRNMQSMGIESRSNNGYRTQSEHPGFPTAEPQTRRRATSWEQHRPPIQIIPSNESEEMSDGKPVEVDEGADDLELTRKLKVLQEIEEKIIFKKAAIALKNVDSRFSKNEQSAPCKAESLRDRVNLILQQRRPGFLPQLPESRLSSHKASLLLEDHPLKLRVKAIMKHRCHNPSLLTENAQVLDITWPPPPQPVTSLVKERTSENEGFQRFLSVLNKGVDIDWLSRIVSNDNENLALGEKLVNIQPSATEDTSEPGKSQQSHSAASLPGCSRTNSGERKSDCPGQNESHNERPSLLDNKEQVNKDDKGKGSVGSHSQSRSPRAATQKKKKEEDTPPVYEQQEHLQNILKTLGLSLEVEEMRQLTDRTQERLYGKTHEGRESRWDCESQQNHPQRHHRNSSSSDSPSTSSRSASRSPSDKKPSHSTDTKQRQVSERSSSGGGHQDSEGAHRPRDIDEDKNRIYQEGTSTSCYQYSQEQTYSHSDPATFSEFYDYSLPAYSSYMPYHTNAAESYSAYTQEAIPPSFDSTCYPYPQVSGPYVPYSVGAPGVIYPNFSFNDTNLLMNPDLSTSEGQVGTYSQRCLQVIKPKLAVPQSLIQIRTKKKKKKSGKKKRFRKWNHMVKDKVKIRKYRGVVVVKDTIQAPVASGGNGGDLETRQLKEGTREPTEEEIKANLRKKLEAFNQRMKQQVTQPSGSLAFQTGSADCLETDTLPGP